MSEMYSRLFELPRNLYATGSPVLISAGALLLKKDTEEVIAQLKIKNIQTNQIKALTINLHGFDISGETCLEKLTFQYLDLTANRNQEFGVKVPIKFSKNTVRSYKVVVKEAIYSDNSIWQGKYFFAPLSEQKTTNQTFQYNELCIQYRIQYGNNANYLLQEVRDLWFCACGGVNRKDEKICHSCPLELSELKSLDMDSLKSTTERRLLEEEERTSNKTKKLKICFMAFTSLCTICVLFFQIFTKIILPAKEYNTAITCFESGNTNLAYAYFLLHQDYKDSQDYLELIDTNAMYKSFSELISCKLGTTIALNDDGTLQSTYQGHEVYDWENIVMFQSHIGALFGVDSRGFVHSSGVDTVTQLAVEKWENIVDISIQLEHTVGLKSDGTVVATGDNEYGRINVEMWSDIKKICADYFCTIGLKNDGTVVSSGFSPHEKLEELQQWEGIQDIITVNSATFGLRENGTVLVSGSVSQEFIEEVSRFDNLVTLVANDSLNSTALAGITTEGNVCVTNTEFYNHSDVADWRDVVQISIAANGIMGLKNDGTVYYVGEEFDIADEIREWTDVIGISCDEYGIETGVVALKSDGTLLRPNSEQQVEVDGWNLFE